MEFNPASASWRVAARVPDDSDTDAFLGLLAHSQNLELIHGNHLSSYDPVIGKVTAHIALKLDMTADGGMAAQDDSTVYLVGARGSRSLMKLDLDTRLLSRIDAPFPNPVATYGNRAVIAPFAGEEILLIAGGNDSSELWSVPTSSLPALTLAPEGQ